MNNVEEYYKQLELTQPVDVRRVYLASDDPTVLKDARAKYAFFSQLLKILLNLLFLGIQSTSSLEMLT
jgi:Alpha-(1,6)-fucosyltransferase N- and catalytic domains